MLYCTVLYCTALYCTVLCCAVLYLLCCAALCCTALLYCTSIICCTECSHPEAPALPDCLFLVAQLVECQCLVGSSKAEVPGEGGRLAEAVYSIRPALHACTEAHTHFRSLAFPGRVLVAWGMMHTCCWCIFVLLAHHDVAPLQQDGPSLAVNCEP